MKRSDGKERVFECSGKKQGNEPNIKINTLFTSKHTVVF